MRSHRLFLVGLICGSVALRAVADDNEYDWLKKYVVVNTTETVDRDLEGDVKGMTSMSETQISVSRKVTEIKQRDAAGVLQPVSRITDTTDTLGGKTTVVESWIPGPGDALGGKTTVPGAALPEHRDLVVTSITVVFKTPTGSITTVQNRNSATGELVVSKRTTVTKDDSGMETTLVESPDATGLLVITQTTTKSQKLKGATP